MARDRLIRNMVAPDALFHRFADLMRGIFLICFTGLALIGFAGTGYFAIQVMLSDVAHEPEFTKLKEFSPPTVEEFQQFADRILDGSILWPTFKAPEGFMDLGYDLTAKDSRAIESGAALLESLVVARGIKEDEERREKAIVLITQKHQRIASLSGAPNISFAHLFFDHLMQASIAPAYFPNRQSVIGQKREQVDRFLMQYPLIHTEWFGQEVQKRIEALVRGSDRRAADQAEFQLQASLINQRMQRNATLALVCLVMFSLSALLFLLIRIERNQTLQTQYMANRYVMYMPTPKSDP